jgi:hypothetical protein
VTSQLKRFFLASLVVLFMLAVAVAIMLGTLARLQPKS